MKISSPKVLFFLSALFSGASDCVVASFLRKKEDSPDHTDTIAVGGDPNYQNDGDLTIDEESPPTDCTDWNNWEDSWAYNCTWYATTTTYDFAENDACTAEGNQWYANGGTANDACCVCGGGVDLYNNDYNHTALDYVPGNTYHDNWFDPTKGTAMWEFIEDP